jgi:hypothetical protein
MGKHSKKNLEAGRRWLKETGINDPDKVDRLALKTGISAMEGRLNLKGTGVMILNEKECEALFETVKVMKAASYLLRTGKVE